MFSSHRFGAFFIAAGAAIAFSWQAHAAPLLNGVAVHTELGKEQFIAGLYSDSLTTDFRELVQADENKRMQVRVVAEDLSSRRFRRMWIEGIAINSNQQALQEHAQNMADFSNMLRAKMINGDILTIERTADAGMEVILNGTTLGTIDDEEFFDLLLLTWIGPVPLSSTFRENLLQAGDVPTDLLTRFESTRPSDQRIAAIERAVSSDREERTAQQRPERRVTAVEEPDEDLLAAPTLDSSALAMAPPSLAPEPGVTASQPPTTQPEPQPEPEPAPTPEPQPAATAPADEPKPAEQPKPAQTQVAKAAPAKPAPSEDDIFEEEDGEAFTAESLLSRQLYIGELKRQAQSKLSYPDRALRRGWEGSVRLDVTLDRKGRVVDVDVSEAAEHSVLTKEALKAVEGASFPPVPDEVQGDTFLFTLPVAFKLQ